MSPQKNISQSYNNLNNMEQNRVENTTENPDRN